MKPILGFYHRADFDGRMCAALLYAKYGEGIKLVGVDYGDDYDELFREHLFEQFYSLILVCDFCFPKNFNKRMMDCATVIRVIDHHEGIAGKIPETSFSSDKFVLVDGRDYSEDLAACELTFMDVFCSEEIPMSVRLVGQYDSWRKDDENNPWRVALEFQYWLRSKDPDIIQLSNMIFDQDDVSLGAMKGEAILDYAMAQARELICQSWTYRLGGYGARVVNYNGSPSLLAECLFGDFPDLDLLITFHALPGGRWKLHFRSHEASDADCAGLAKLFGGGGHKNAGGALVGFNKIEKFLPLWK